MSLNSEKQTAINELKTLMAEMRTRTEESDDEFAERMINLFYKWFISAKVNYTTGLTAPNGPVTGEFNGKLE